MASAACVLAATCFAAPALAAAAEEAIQPVYFGNGCFWGRQYDFISAEQALGRAPDDVSAVVVSF